MGLKRKEIYVGNDNKARYSTSRIYNVNFDINWFGESRSKTKISDRVTEVFEAMQRKKK